MFSCSSCEKIHQIFKHDEKQYTKPVTAPTAKAGPKRIETLPIAMDYKSEKIGPTPQTDQSQAAKDPATGPIDENPAIHKANFAEKQAAKVVTDPVNDAFASSFFKHC